MKYAIVSDIHANIQAWDAVIEDIQKQGVDAILCLGDVIGYGPNPAEVLESCHQHVDYFILGNHDAVIGNRMDSNLFNDSAKYLIEWTRNQLNDEAAKFFGNMSLRMEGETFACAHAELALPGRFSYLYEPNDCISSFDATRQQVLFVGHTHMQAKFTWKDGRLLQGKSENFNLEEGARYLINAGSVGDPRDGKTNAHYVIYDEEKKSIQYRSIPFDIYGFKINLAKAKLPVTPFFVMIDEGQMKNAETIKDMEVMEDNQVSNSDTEVTIFNKEEMLETRTRRLTRSISFSPEMMEKIQTHRQKIEEKKQRTRGFEQYEKKKSNSALITIIILLLIAIIISAIIVLKKNKDNTEAAKNPDKEIIKNDQSIVSSESISLENDEPTSSGLLLYEGFEYSDKNSFLENSSGKGWGKSWEISEEGELTFENPNTSGTGNSLCINNKALLVRYLDISQEGSFFDGDYLNVKGQIGKNNKTLYISFITKHENIQHSFELGFGRNKFSNNRWGIESISDKKEYILRTSIRNHQLSAASSESIKWVIKVDFKSSRDGISIYINPSSSQEPKKPDFRKNNTGNLVLDHFYIKNNNDLKLYVDELRIGNSFESVFQND